MQGRTYGWVVVGVAVLIGAHAGAAAAAAQPARQRAAQAAGADPAEVARLFDAYTVMQAQEALALSDEQFGPFVSRLRALQQARRRHLRERAVAVRELRRLLETAGNDAVLRERLDALAKLDAAAQADTAKASAAIDEILDVRQRARFRVLEQQLELRKLELVGRARQRLRTPAPTEPRNPQ